MSNSMILISDDGKTRTFQYCPACPILPIDHAGAVAEDTTIPLYYSVKHAKDAGWRPTKDIKFCDPDLDYVWVCPDCWPGDAN